MSGKLTAHGVRGTVCSRAISWRARTLRTVAGWVFYIAAGLAMSLDAEAVTIYLKNGQTFNNATILKRTEHTITVRTDEGRFKFFPLRDIAEIQDSTVAPPPRLQEPSGIKEVGIKGMYAFRTAGGKIVYTNRPEQYDANFYEPHVVPLGKAEFFEQRHKGKVTVVSSGMDDASSLSGYNDIEEIIDFHARRNGLSRALVKAIIRAESNGDPYARSECGACGLMQLMPATAAEMGIFDIFDPDKNIAGGTLYLAKMFEVFGGDKRLALAAYNAGPGAVKKYRGVPPYPETRNYVDRVLRFEKQYASGAPFQLAADKLTPWAGYAPSLPEEQTPFRVTLTSGLTICGSYYRQTDGGIHLKTPRKWEFVRNELIRETNFT